MASAGAFPPPSPLASQLTNFERTMIMLGSMMSTLMQLLDTTIANVALPHMQTSLGATTESITWVLTSYIVASAVAIPITGWLSDRIGRKQLYVGATFAFTVFSALCAVATSLPEIVAFRILQGIAGAFVVPIGQAILFDINPPDKAAKAMTIFGLGALVGPAVGPVLGGWLTENFNWRWVFLINLPVGLLSATLLIRFLPSTEQSKQRFDIFGYALLAIAIGAMQMMLDRGQQEDWFQSWEIWIESGLVLAAGWMFVVHLFTTKESIFDPAIFADRNFTMTLIFSTVMGLVLLGGSALVPPLLQRLLGYTVLQSGLLAAPRGIGSIVAMLVATRTNNRVDPRLMIFFGTCMMAFSLWIMTGYTLQMDQHLVIMTGLMQGFGMGLCWVPISLLGFATIAPHLRTSAAGMMTLFRNIGGSIGISVMSTVLARNMQTSHSDLASQITPSSTPVLDPGVLGMVGNAGQSVMAMLDAEINRQAAMVAYIDDFKMMMIGTLLSLPLILLLRNPGAAEPIDQPIMMD
jgi:MFS transporter, DHA2 family, multidrug resistance protein